MGRLWRPSDAPRPTFTPIVAPCELTADEQERLAVYRDLYPYLEWVETRQQMNRLVLQRWLWRNGDDE